MISINNNRGYDVSKKYAKEFMSQRKKNIEMQKDSPKYDFSKVKGYKKK